ncbi:phospholipid carrier-dependent glycosyltransferase, partial [bacterium]|nr:phospholipid carrier-dependent glycosyltransferase [bacterium]
MSEVSLSSARPRASGGEKAAAALVLLLSCVVLIGALGGRSLENKDITRTAEIGSLASVFLVFAWTTHRRGIATGTAAAGFLATGQLFLEIGRQSRVDSLFAFFLAASVVLAHEAERGKLARSLGLGVASGVALGLAALTKTPLAIALHMSVVGAWAALDTALERPWRARPGSPAAFEYAKRLALRLLGPGVWLPPIVAGLVYGAWFLPFWRSLTESEQAEWWHQFRYENTDRIKGESDKPKPFYFYVPRLLVQCAPGSLLALALPHAVFLRVRRDEAKDETRFSAFASVWWIVPFLTFSIARGKDVRYLLPCLPGLAVAAGEAWRIVEESAQRGARGAHVLRRFTARAAFVFCASAVGVIPVLAWVF